MTHSVTVLNRMVSSFLFYIWLHFYSSQPHRLLPHFSHIPLSPLRSFCQVLSSPCALYVSQNPLYSTNAPTERLVHSPILPFPYLLPITCKLHALPGLSWRVGQHFTAKRWWLHSNLHSFIQQITGSAKTVLRNNFNYLSPSQYCTI
jgi:hypothetical protein